MKNKDQIYELEAILNTLQMYHPCCTCPTHDECVAAGDSWRCELCLAQDGLEALGKLAGYEDEEACPAKDTGTETVKPT